MGKGNERERSRQDRKRRERVYTTESLVRVVTVTTETTRWQGEKWANELQISAYAGYHKWANETTRENDDPQDYAQDHRAAFASSCFASTAGSAGPSPDDPYIPFDDADGGRDSTMQHRGLAYSSFYDTFLPLRAVTTLVLDGRWGPAICLALVSTSSPDDPPRESDNVINFTLDKVLFPALAELIFWGGNFQIRDMGGWTACDALTQALRRRSSWFGLALRRLEVHRCECTKDDVAVWKAFVKE